ncbi:phage head-tail connector protein [Gemmata sp. G18]|uniref:Phage head-tail connector protein n=1 Tax=Gemmata palustris TaxID=2822762 RepID=A0ABS5BNU3_9BACT|nr:phage head-tail connector protein [Gemmata palustris]
MLRQSLALITPPATEPVTLAEAKAWARVDGTEEDAIFTALITAARQAAEEFLRRSLITQTWKLTLDLCAGANKPWWDGVREGAMSSLYGGLPGSVPLPKGPVQSISSVVTYDLNNAASTFAASNYRVDASGDRLLLNYGAVWPSNVRPEAGCEITYVAGYGAAAAVPQPIKTGILTHVAALYEQRGQCDDPSALPPAALSLYGRYRVMGDRLG